MPTKPKTPSKGEFAMAHDARDPMLTAEERQARRRARRLWVAAKVVQYGPTQDFYQRIVRAFGVSSRTARADVAAVLKRMTSDASEVELEFERTLFNERIEGVVRDAIDLHRAAKKDGNSRDRAAALKVLLNALQIRARVSGFEAPMQITGAGGQPLVAMPSSDEFERLARELLAEGAATAPIVPTEQATPGGEE